MRQATGHMEDSIVINYFHSYERHLKILLKIERPESIDKHDIDTMCKDLENT